MITPQPILPPTPSPGGSVNQPPGGKFVFTKAISGAMLITVLAFLSAVAYAIFLYKTDEGLDLLIIALPILPFIFAAPTFLVAVVVLMGFGRGKMFIPSVINLSIIAAAAPWGLYFWDQHQSKITDQKILNYKQELKDTRNIRACESLYNYEKWQSCVTQSIFRSGDKERCERQGISQFRSRPEQSIKDFCNSFNES